MQTLEKLIENLNNKEEVDSLVIFGSKGLGEEKSYSDIDLGIILKENPKKIFSLFQWIDDRPADIFFYDLETLKKLTIEEEIPANTMDAVLVSSLEKAKIAFDKSGVVTSMKNNFLNLRSKLQVPKTEMKKFEVLINSAYITNKRYFESNNAEYYEILEIKILQDVYTILMAYFEFRNIPWRGEKQVIKYLKENDSNFYNLYMSCLRANDIKEKFEIYNNLVNKVFCGSYGLWDKNVIDPYIKGVMEDEQKEDLVNYWKNLLLN